MCDVVRRLDHQHGRVRLGELPGDRRADAARANDDHIVGAVGLGGRVAGAGARARAAADAAVGAVLDRELRRDVFDVHLCREPRPVWYDRPARPKRLIGGGGPKLRAGWGMLWR